MGIEVLQRGGPRAAYDYGLGLFGGGKFFWGNEPVFLIIRVYKIRRDRNKCRCSDLQGYRSVGLMNFKRGLPSQRWE
jgi:hypothetical protein